jgi:hypothetical protein
MKWMIEFVLTILYIITLGSLTFSAEFPDGTEFCLNGWFD